MELKGKHVILTGATGGIGEYLARRLVEQGALLMMVARREHALGELHDRIRTFPDCVITLAADVATREGREKVRQAVDAYWSGQVDVLINNAAVMAFGSHAEIDEDILHNLVNINVEAPMQLTRALLPTIQASGGGQIVFVGSILGALGLPYYSAYCASKFALRGFAEALRREIHNDGISVCYVGPRAVDTPMNDPLMRRVGIATGTNMDEPDWVADQIIEAMNADRSETHLGFPEKMFARINRASPSIVDGNMFKLQQQMKQVMKDGN